MALKNIVSGAGSFAGALSEKFDDVLFLALKVLAIGVACLAVHKYSGLRAGNDDLAWYMFFGLGLVAIGFEYYGGQTIIDGWFSRKAGAIVLGACLCAPALAFSYSNAIGSASVQQSKSAGLQKASHNKTVNAEKALKESEFALQVAKDARSKLQPKRSAADARAVIDSTSAHKWWKATNECRETQGPKTREFCDNYRSAQADLKAWDDISVQDQRVDAAQKKFDAALEAQNTGEVEVSDVRADTLDYANFFGTSVEEGQKIQARHVALTVTLFVTFAGFMTGWKRNRDKELKPWGIVDWCRCMWFKAWNGLDAEPPSAAKTHSPTIDASLATPGSVTVNMTDLSEDLREALRAMKDTIQASGLKTA